MGERVENEGDDEGLGGRSADAAIGLALGLVATAVALASRQPSFFGDGRDIAVLVERGAIAYHHLAYFPLARAFAWLVGPFAERPHETGPLLLAALAYGAAVAVTFCCARRLRLVRGYALVAAALLATVPVAFFHATCIEVHGVQLFVATLVAGWIVERERTPPGTRANAIAPAVGWIALTGAHLSGGLWAPVLLVAALKNRGRGWTWPRHVPVALLLLASAVSVWSWLNTAGSTGRRFVAAASESVLVALDGFDFLWSQMVAPFGVLTVAALVVAFARVMRARARAGPLDLATLLALVLFAPFAAALHLEEQGGYFIALAPLCVLCVVRAVHEFAATLDVGVDPKAARSPLAALWLVVAAHAVAANERWIDWNLRYEGREWLEPLKEELGPRGWVLTRTYGEARTVFYHSRLESQPFDDGSPMNVPWEAIAPVVIPLIERTAAAGGRGAVLASLWSSPKPVHRELVAELVERFGRPRARGPGYLLFPEAAPPAGVGTQGH